MFPLPQRIHLFVLFSVDLGCNVRMGQIGQILFCPFPLKWTIINTFYIKNIFYLYTQLWNPSFDVIQNNYRTDCHLQCWAVTWISKICRAIYTNKQQFINYPSTAPSVRRLQALQFLCHPVYARLQYARRNSFSFSAAQQTECHLIHYASITEDEMRKESSLGKHHRTVFVLII